MNIILANTHVKAKVQLKQDVGKYFHGNCPKRAKILCYNWFFQKKYLVLGLLSAHA